MEAASTNQLFNVVVDNDEVASKIIEYLNRDKVGRCYFKVFETAEFGVSFPSRAPRLCLQLCMGNQPAAAFPC